MIEQKTKTVLKLCWKGKSLRLNVFEVFVEKIEKLKPSIHETKLKEKSVSEKRPNT